MKKTYSHLVGLALLSAVAVFLLGACSSGQKEKTTSSSSSKVEQAVKASKTSSKEKTDKKASSNDAGNKADTSSDKSIASSKQVETPKEEPKKDQPSSEKDSASQQGDTSASAEYAQLAGTWSNDEGATITINPDGTTSDGAKIMQGKTTSGVYTSTMYSKEGFGASFFYAPAGQAFPEEMAPKEYTEGTDINRERIVIAQSVDRMAHPFYRAD